MTREERLAVARLTSGRFAGRAELERSAERGDPRALLDLEVALGLRTAEGARAEAWRGAHPDCRALRVAALAAGETMAPIDAAVDTHSAAGWTRAAGLAYVDARRALRAARAADRAIPAVTLTTRVARRQEPHPGVDLAIAHRQPLAILDWATRRAAASAIADAPIRTAAHDHNRTIVVVPAGEETARSSSGTISSRAAGMSRAYCRSGYTVTSSTHTWHVSREHGVRVLDGRVYLSPTVRVRAGRGTALVVERLTAGARGLRWQ